MGEPPQIPRGITSHRLEESPELMVIGHSRRPKGARLESELIAGQAGRSQDPGGAS